MHRKEKAERPAERVWRKRQRQRGSANIGSAAQGLGTKAYTKRDLGGEAHCGGPTMSSHVHVWCQVVTHFLGHTHACLSVEDTKLPCLQHSAPCQDDAPETPQSLLRCLAAIDVVAQRQQDESTRNNNLHFWARSRCSRFPLSLMPWHRVRFGTCIAGQPFASLTGCACRWVHVCTCCLFRIHAGPVWSMCCPWML
jgi:hypothetical protein